MLDERQIEERKYQIETEIRSMGNADNSVDVAERCGITREAMSMFLKKEFKTTFSKLRKSLQPETGVTPISSWLPIPLTKEEKKKGVKQSYSINGAKRWVYRIARSCPILSTEDRSWSGKRIAPLKKDSVWSEEIEVVKDRYIQPIKRVRIAAHSFLSAGIWRTGKRLLEVSVDIAKTERDLYLTQEDAMIISDRLALNEGLKVGDKILGLNGLKCVICLIRKQKKDITVNEKQIFGDKESRHNFGAVKELKEKGTLSIFFSKGSPQILTQKMRAKYEREGKTTKEINEIQDFLMCEYEYTPKERHEYPTRNKASVSPTIVPFLLKVFGADLSVLLKHNAEDVQGVLKMVNMEFNLTDKGLTLNPLLKQPKDTNKVWGSHFWNETTKAEYSGKPQYFNPKEEVITEPGGFTPFSPYVTVYPFTMEKIYLPAIFYENALWVTKYGDIETNEFYRILLTPKGKQGISALWFLNKAIFGVIENSLTGLVAIPILEKDKRIVTINPSDKELLKLNKQNTGVVYREPIVSDENIQHVHIKTSVDIPVGKIGVSVELQKEMYGDFDGDSLSIIGTEGVSTLNPKGWYELPKLKLRKPKGLPEKIPAPRSEKEQLLLAEKEHNYLIQMGKDVSEAGFLTKIGFIRCENEKEFETVVKSAKILEIMKDRESKIERQKFYKGICDLEKVGHLWYKNGGRRLDTKDCNGQMKFNAFCSASKFKMGLKGIPLITTLLNKPHAKHDLILASKESPYAKWIMLLQNIPVTLRIVEEKLPISKEKKKLRRVEINREVYKQWKAKKKMEK